MKTFFVAASLILSLSPAFAEDPSDHAAHHPATASSAAASQATAPADQSGQMMNGCPMMKEGASGRDMQNNQQMNMNMENGKMMQCPMMSKQPQTGTSLPGSDQAHY